MLDLNDFMSFHAVATNQGFSAAARTIGVPKGTLSKSVTRLEARLKVRLLDRTTRKLCLTEVGRAVFEQCQVILAGGEAAAGAAAAANAEPSGLVRMSCLQGLIQNLIADILPGFMKVYPRVRVEMKVINRRADLIEDQIDIALRARTTIEADSSVVARNLGGPRLVLAVAPEFLQRSIEPPTIEGLPNMETLSMAEDREGDSWDLVGPDGAQKTIRHRPRLMCSNLDVLHAAARDGVGVALLPEHLCRSSFVSGALVPLLPEWHSPFGSVEAVFLTRKGLVPAIRALIDHLAIAVPRQLSDI
jgi:DNA-binding transcriptional LysR family regulator